MAVRDTDQGAAHVRRPVRRAAGGDRRGDRGRLGQGEQDEGGQQVRADPRADHAWPTSSTVRNVGAVDVPDRVMFPVPELLITTTE